MATSEAFVDNGNNSRTTVNKTMSKLDEKIVPNLSFAINNHRIKDLAF